MSTHNHISFSHCHFTNNFEGTPLADSLLIIRTHLNMLKSMFQCLLKWKTLRSMSK